MTTEPYRYRRRAAIYPARQSSPRGHDPRRRLLVNLDKGLRQVILAQPCQRLKLRRVRSHDNQAHIFGPTFQRQNGAYRALAPRITPEAEYRLGWVSDYLPIANSSHRSGESRLQHGYAVGRGLTPEFSIKRRVFIADLFCVLLAVGR